MARRILALLCCLALAAPLGCDDDDEGFGDLGAPCNENAHCQQRCVRGGDWPGGMCTYDCASDDDCPGGTACVDRAGGVCAVLCDVNDDCRAFGFDQSYDCRETNREGGGGNVRVCRG